MGNCKSFGRTRGRNGPAIQCRAVAGKYQGRERSQSKGPSQSEGGGRGQSNRQGQGPALVDSTTRSEPENPLEGWCVQSPRKGAARTATLGDENGMCDEGLRVIFIISPAHHTWHLSCCSAYKTPANAIKCPDHGQTLVRRDLSPLAAGLRQPDTAAPQEQPRRKPVRILL